MELTRNQFFLICIAILIGIFFAYKLVWVITARKTVGEVIMTGHGNLGSALGLSTYQVIKFQAKLDTVVFNSEFDLGLQSGEKVHVLYHRDNPGAAKTNSFTSIWVDSIIYSVGPLLVLIVIFVTPDLIPKKSKIVIGMRGISITSNEKG
jgi:hypothetical protein